MLKNFNSYINKEISTKEEYIHKHHIPEKLYLFLYMENVLDEYVHNFEIDYPHELIYKHNNRYKLREWIKKSFNWRNTIEGADFWFKINRKWQNFCRMENINESLFKKKDKYLKVGDICIFKRGKLGTAGIPDTFLGKECTIDKILNHYYRDYVISFINTPYDGLVVNDDNLELLDKKEIERREKLKKELSIKMKDIDPYGEEDWLSEKRIPYKKELCQDIWEGITIIERIRLKLLKIARDFYNDIEFETEIKDIVLTGSMVNFNYTEESDIDVHIIIDFKDVNDDTELVKKAIDGQRFIWNLRHNIIIKGHDVELYIQDISEEHKSLGLYSLLNNKWVTKPIYNPPDVDTQDVNIKYDARVYDILRFEKISKQDLSPEQSEEYYNNAKDLKAKIMKSRKEGLSEEGEFSIENLVFKKLRKEGKIKKLIDTIIRFYDKIYSQ